MRNRGSGSSADVARRKEMEIAVFRIVREAIDNAIRHGKARRIAMAAEASGQRLALIVQDDGDGFDSEAVFAGREADKSSFCRWPSESVVPPR